MSFSTTAAVSVPQVSVPSSTITVIDTDNAADSAATPRSGSIGSAVTVTESLALDSVSCGTTVAVHVAVLVCVPASGSTCDETMLSPGSKSMATSLRIGPNTSLSRSCIVSV